MRFENRKFTILVSIGIICILGSFLFPLFLGALTREMIYFQKGAFAFSSDTISYIIFSIAFIIIGVAFILLAIDRISVKIRTLITSVLFLVAAASMVLSIDNVYFGTEKGFYFNDLKTLGTVEIPWEDVTEMEQVYVRSDYSTKAHELNFKLQNGQNYVIKYNKYLQYYRGKLEGYVMENGGKSIITEIKEKDIK
ncbi:hypothetical protein M3589_07530 [Heyndrickxia oleronia]|uniref:hypothetical protein n=1 Tax=Heyndrickxia oleronia TaxID=38875 RepID=UPI0020419E27|nr:hypothetical protein [Heyndrickxia oleronia]MCM3237575.1 hypothetical protein [Heyndrickxia oleronia]